MINVQGNCLWCGHLVVSISHDQLENLITAETHVLKLFESDNHRNEVHGESLVLT